MNQGTIQRNTARKKPHIYEFNDVKFDAKYVQEKPYYHQEITRENITDRMPWFLKSKAKKAFENHGFDKGYDYLLRAKSSLDRVGISLTYNDKKLAEIAEAHAESAQILEKQGGYALTLRYVENLGIDLPAGKTEESRAARVKDADWWMRRLRTLQIRAQETIAREFGVVHKKANVYISDSAVSRIEARRARSWEILKTMEAVNCDNEEERLNMHDVAMKSIANPENRHNELMVRAAGFDAYSRRHGHVADFYTITTPSKYHAYHHYGKPNINFRGFSPRDGQDYLVTIWARIRSKLKRKKIQIYGLRIAEPHHDGTPHWHMLLYVQKKHRQKLRSIIRAYAIKEDKKELNFLYGKSAGKLSAEKVDRRYLVKGIDPARGSGASYILKYIAKNIQGITGDDGGNTKDFETGTDSKETANRVSVWASVWGIRQFQQIGGGSITIWRELRKIRELERGSSQGDLFDLWESADNNEWDTFIMLLGGADMPKSQQLAGLYKEIAQPEVRVCENTGEYFDLSLNKYGESRELVLGVENKKDKLLTREKRWRIENVPEMAGGNGWNIADVELNEEGRKFSLLGVL